MERTESAHPAKTVQVRAVFSGGVLWGVFLLALLVRLGCGLALFWRSADPNALQFPDEKQYWLIASSWWQGHGLRDELGFRAGRMPLYPMLLSPFTALEKGIFWAKAANSLLSALAAPLTALLAGRFLANRWATLAAILVALDPFLVYSAGLLLTEALFTVALLTLLVVAVDEAEVLRRRSLTRSRWTLIGLLGALCIYSRESSFGLVLLLVAYLFVFGRNKRALFGASLSLGVIVLLLLPWAVRNRLVTGEMYWLTSRGGLSLYDGVHAGATGASDLGDIKDMPQVRGLSEAQRDDYFRREAWKSIRSDPLRILQLARVKLARLWNPLPNLATHQSMWVRIVAGGWTAPLFLLAATGVCLWRFAGRSWTSLVLLLLPVIYFTLLHCMFVGSVRYRLPLTPILCLLAASGASSILRFLAGAHTKRGAA